MTGSSCLPWCAGTHRGGTDIHEGPVHPLRSAAGAQMWSKAMIWETGPHISVTAFAEGTVGTVLVRDQDNAVELANMLDALGSAAPADIRAFAAQVRQASAQAFGEPETGA